MCEALHTNGIRVILDGVFNHVGRDFFAFKDVQQKRWDSPYCGWFQNLHFNGQSPYGDPFWYEGWAGHYDLVKLNLQNEDVVRYLLDSAVFLQVQEARFLALRRDHPRRLQPHRQRRHARFRHQLRVLQGHLLQPQRPQLL
nr:alpha-amylase family glycosyl hydrolase [uncultured Ruminococcus sp.]